MIEKVDRSAYAMALNGDSHILKLLVRPAPQVDEHTFGYHLRLAHVNGLANPAWLSNFSAGKKIARRMGRTRWCPLCLDEAKPYWRQSWTLSAGVCWAHQCWLVDACLGCNAEMTWQKVRLLTCQCGYSLSEAPAIFFTKELADLLSEVVQPLDDNLVWRGLNIEGRWNVARFLGALQIYGLHGKPLKKVSRIEISVEREVATAGARILLKGSDGFHRLLDGLRTPPSGRATVQLINDAFPGLLTRLRRSLALQERESLLLYVRSYVARSTARKVAVMWREGASFHAGSTHRCAVALGIRRDRVSALLKQQGVSLKVRTSPTGRKMLAVGPEDLGRVRNALSTALPKREVSKIFGISSGRQDELIKCGLLKALGRKIDRASVELLFDKIAAGCPKGKSDKEQEIISLYEALRTLVPRPLTASFFNVLLANRIDVLCITRAARAADNIQLSRIQVINFLAEKKDRSSDYMAIPEAAHLLGLKQEVLYHLVNQGMINVKYERAGRRTARFIDRSELERFDNEIEPLAKVARRFGVGSKSVLEWAQSQGLAVVSGPAIDGGRQYFVRRSEGS